jgi:hypothetical protein
VHGFFLSGNLNLRDDLGSLGVEGMMLLIRNLNKWSIGRVGRSYLPQRRDHQQELVNTAVTFRLTQKGLKFLTT